MKFANFCFYLLLAALVAAGFGEKAWFLDLFSHGVLQYWLMAFVLLIVFLVKKNKFKSYLTAALLICTGLQMAVAVINRAPEIKNPRPADRIRFFELNTSGNPKILTHWLPVHAAEFDILVLLEATPDFDELLTSLKTEFPYQVSHLENSPFGIAVLSRWPFQQTTEFESEGGMYPQYRLEVKSPKGNEFLLFAVHLPPPFAPQMAQAHEVILGELTQKLQEKKLPAVVVGDLSTSQYSKSFAKLVKNTELRDTAGVSPWQNTWPTMSLNLSSFLGIRIDHCLVSTSFSLVEREQLEDLGSDHLPVKCTLQMER